MFDFALSRYIARRSLRTFVRAALVGFLIFAALVEYALVTKTFLIQTAGNLEITTNASAPGAMDPLRFVPLITISLTCGLVGLAVSSAYRYGFEIFPLAVGLSKTRRQTIFTTLLMTFGIFSIAYWLTWNIGTLEIAIRQHWLGRGTGILAPSNASMWHYFFSTLRNTADLLLLFTVFYRFGRKMIVPAFIALAVLISCLSVSSVINLVRLLRQLPPMLLYQSLSENMKNLTLTLADLLILIPFSLTMNPRHRAA